MYLHGCVSCMPMCRFDEMPEVFNQSVYQIFGGLKKQCVITLALIHLLTPSGAQIEQADVP